MLPGYLSTVISRIVYEPIDRRSLLPSHSDRSPGSSCLRRSEQPAAEGVTHLAEAGEASTQAMPPERTSTRNICRDARAHRKRKGKTNTGVGAKLLHIVRKRDSPRQEECVGCYQRVATKKLVACPCEHKYCHTCLRAMAGVALSKQGYFPVRCCAQEIPSKDIMAIMARQGRKAYESRAREHAVPPAERWYCPRSTCGRWIPPEQIDAHSASQTCRSCHETICSTCRGPDHESWNCLHDSELQVILDVARRHHWQRCYQCHALVEKVVGCSHMYCRCKAQFCYTCGGPYRKCWCKAGLGGADDGDDLALDGNVDVRMVAEAMNQADREEVEEAEEE